MSEEDAKTFLSGDDGAYELEKVRLLPECEEARVSHRCWCCEQELAKAPHFGIDSVPFYMCVSFYHHFGNRADGVRWNAQLRCEWPTLLDDYQLIIHVSGLTGRKLALGRFVYFARPSCERELIRKSC